MSVASALAIGSEPSPRLAEAAVREALERAGLTRARGILLFLSSHFARRPQAAFLAAARSGACLQVLGMAAPGLCTEEGWVLDRPAAAALVLGGRFGLAAGSPERLSLSLAGGVLLPPAGREGPPRFGMVAGDSPIWLNGRPAGDGPGEAEITGARARLAVSTGLRALAPAREVEEAHGHDLDRIGGLAACDSLLRALPPELRDRHALPLHLLAAVREDGPPQAVPLLSANADGSLTLAEPLRPGERIVWTLRQPLTAENDMRQAVDAAAAVCPRPAFALMLSCIGRGPLFYGGDDRDLALCRERWPGMPLIGAYGNGQLAPLAGRNRQLHNCVVTALFEAEDV